MVPYDQPEAASVGVLKEHCFEQRANFSTIGLDQKMDREHTSHELDGYGLINDLYVVCVIYQLSKMNSPNQSYCPLLNHF
jgi:hypothetical protein